MKEDNNEDTQMLNSAAEETPAQAATPAKKHSSTAAAAAAGAAGGFVAGAASGAATTAAAAAIPAEEPEVEVLEEVEEVGEVEEQPVTEQETLLVNDEGIRVAHVQADSFSEAFAQARQQVGAGGVFEYNGQIYGTYYADEWNNMSAAERAEYQNRVSGIAPTQHHDYHSDGGGSGAAHSGSVASNAQIISPEPVDDDVRVLGLDTMDNGEGGVMNVALVEMDGESVLLVDIDNDGRIDVMVHDDNGDGELQDSEFHNISSADIELADLEAMHAAQNGDYLTYASSGDMPDYLNDADSIMTV